MSMYKAITKKLHLCAFNMGGYRNGEQVLRTCDYLRLGRGR